MQWQSGSCLLWNSSIPGTVVSRRCHAMAVKFLGKSSFVWTGVSVPVSGVMVLPWRGCVPSCSNVSAVPDGW